MELFSDLTSCLITTPIISRDGYLKLISLFTSTPTVTDTPSQSPVKRLSPLRKEYKVPGAWPEHVSSAPPQTTPRAPTPALEEVEDDEEYDPDYATYLLADMITQHELKQRRENEELYRAHMATQAVRHDQSQTRRWLGENLVYGDVKRVMRGYPRTIRASEDKKSMMESGWAREGKMDVVHTMGAGTPAREAHKRYHEFLEHPFKKRKRDSDDEGYATDIQTHKRPMKRMRQRRHC